MSTGYKSVRAVAKPAGYDRLIIDGVDVTFFRGGVIPIPEYLLTEPFAYGPMTLPIPRVAADLEELGVGDLSWVRDGARVLVQRVDDPTAETPAVLATDYVGRVLCRVIDGRSLALEIGGEFSGPASLINIQPILHRRVRDVGLFFAETVRRVHLRPEQRDGPVTGIKIANGGEGLTLEAWGRELGAQSQTSAGIQRAIMPLVWGGKVWGFHPKDTTTVDVTLFTDDARVVPRLRDDVAEKPNTFYATCITPDGVRMRGSVYPNLFDSVPPEFPGTMSVGDTDADTTTGDGVTVLNNRLVGLYLLDRDEPFAYGDYTADTAAVVREIQDRAGLPVTGVVNEATWNRVYDVDATGGSLGQARIIPTVQDPAVREFDLTPTGAVAGKNPLRDISVLEVHRNLDYGAGVTYKQELANTRGQYAKVKNNKNWVGEVELHGGFGGYAGDWGPEDFEFLNGPGGVPYIMSQRDIRPGMNAKLAMIDGGTMVHISGARVSPQSRTTTLTVDTMARDLLEVAAIMARNAEARRSPRREFFTENRAGKASGIMIVRDQWFGKLPQIETLEGGKWNVFRMVIGQHGSVNKTVIRTFDEPAKFYASAWSIPITEKRLHNHVPNPAEVPGDTAWYETDWAGEMHEDRKLLWAAGTDQDPCGYWPKHHTNPRTGAVTAHPITGKHVDIGSPWTYYQSWDSPATVWVAIYPDRDCKVRAGQMFWPQEDDAI